MTTASNENHQHVPMLLAIGRRVQRLREQADIKPADFARSAGFSQQYLWRLENGQQNVNVKTLARLALALDMPMAAILQGIEPDPVALEKRPYVKKTDG
ncbi:helix-turn-helix domain-containing protein [Sphingomonas sp. TF3]|uniref:helix-turn-helix domain-containing protein n=1 Tax=Sphingomonas sp. TF3 TaxID=2495580 RepID=UPI00163C2519|nr:helix-turn-helix transcriptional regulator [Sphingomonas sp. TF3]